MRKIIEQAVVTLDGQVSTPQDWLPTRWAGEFEQLSKDANTLAAHLISHRTTG